MDVMEEANEVASPELNHNVDKTFNGLSAHMGIWGLICMKVSSLEVATELPLVAWDDDYRSVTGY